MREVPMKYWVTVSVPVEMEGEHSQANAQDALDHGWEKIIDPNGPAEGLVTVVTAEQPVIAGVLLQEAA